MGKYASLWAQTAKPQYIVVGGTAGTDTQTYPGLRWGTGARPAYGCERETFLLPTCGFAGSGGADPHQDQKAEVWGSEK